MRSVLVVWLVLSTACSEPRKRSEETRDPPVASLSTSAPAASASVTTAEGDERHPIVEIEGSEIRLDGKVVAPIAPDVDDRVRRIDELFRALKERRETFKTLHPDKDFPGVVGIRVANDVSTVVFKSVFQTAAFAGYPYISVQRAGDAGSIIDIVPQIPGPPSPEPIRPGAGVPVFHVRVAPDGVELEWRRGGEILAEKKLSRDADALKVTACDLWRAHGVHKEKSHAVRDRAIIRADNKMPFRDLRPLFDAVLACTRDGEDGQTSAFDITLAIN